MMKKILKGFGIFLLVFLILLIAAPFIFKGKIQDMVMKAINDNVNATVSIENFDLSLLKNFPKATVTIVGLSVINKAPFEGDTLVYLASTQLKMSVKELLKGGDETMELESFDINKGLINTKVNKDGVSNFDIALKTDEEEKPEEETESSPFSLKVQEYSFTEIDIRYEDVTSNMKMLMQSLNHYGTGDFTATTLDLDTKTNVKLNFSMDNVAYLSDVALQLNAVLGLDLENSVYTFKENEALINKLPLHFDGYVKMLEAGQEMKLTFETPSSEFTNFLALIPAAFNAGLENIKSTGNFSIVGKVDGVYSETTIPTFDIAIAAKNASFKFPDLPKSIDNIQIDTKITNTTGLMKDILVDVNQFAFKIDQDQFALEAHIKNVTENALVDSHFDGTINLGNLTKAYPVELDFPLSGIFTADVTTKFDMESIEKEQYANVESKGTLELKGFDYALDKNKKITISDALVVFNPERLTLQNFEAKTGKSDLQIKGQLDNFFGFLFKDQTLRGNFNMNSNQLVVSDFMTTETPETKSDENATEKPVATTETEALNIPAFLDCTINANAKSVLYDNLNLQNVTGQLLIKDQTVTLNKVKTDIFQGQITFDGFVATKTAVPTFEMDLGLNNIDITQAFTSLDMLKKIAPIAGVVTGKTNATMKIAGDLDPKELTPNLSTLSGDLMGQLMNAKVVPENSKVLSALSSNVSFLDMSKLNLNDVKTALTFSDGKVNVKPFDIKYQDFAVNVGGSHGFDQNMNYNLKMDVPTKYLGKEVNDLIAKLSPAESSKVKSIPLSGLVSGNFASPKVSTDMKQATTTLMNQLVEQQKQALINKGKNELTNLINKNVKGSDSTKTSIPVTKEEIETKKEEVKEEIKEKAKDKVKEGLNGLLNKKKN
uniref:AsmA family protein n=1 Tax=Flavobacterium sp. TaxID=239 RepID=UPI00404A3FBA